MGNSTALETGIPMAMGCQMASNIATLTMMKV